MKADATAAYGGSEMGIGAPDGTLGFMHYVGIADTFGKTWNP